MATIKELEKKVEGIESSLVSIVELLKAKEDAIKTEPQKVVDAEKKSAEPNNAYIEPVHPEWVADAKLKIGEALDHCEVDYPKNGNPRYTVVIKNEFSNASSSHLQFYKIDRRTVAVFNGFETVKQFNSLVAQNLKLNPKKLD